MKHLWFLILPVLVGCQTQLPNSRNIANDEVSSTLSYLDSGDKLTFNKDISLTNRHIRPIHAILCDKLITSPAGDEIYCKLEIEIPPRTTIEIKQMDHLFYSGTEKSPRNKFISGSGKAYELFCRNGPKALGPTRDIHKSLQFMTLNHMMGDCFKLSKVLPDMRVEPVNHPSPMQDTPTPTDI